MRMHAGAKMVLRREGCRIIKEYCEVMGWPRLDIEPERRL